MKTQSKFITESARQTINSAVPLIIAVILLLVVGKFGISKISEVKNDINKTKVDQTILTQKLKLLQVLDKIVKTNGGVVFTALPDKNSSLIVISQLKLMAIKSGILVSGVKSSSALSVLPGINEAGITFSVFGSREKVFEFIKIISNIAPVSHVVKISLTEEIGGTRADLNVKTYWTDLPKNIPAIKTPITDLSTTERESLSRISTLIQPEFTTLAPSTEINPIPFGE